MALIDFVVYDFALGISNAGTILNEISTRITSNYLSYASPFALVQTIAYFELFNTKKVKNNKIINWLSACIFGIYLIHNNNYVRKIIYKFLNIDKGPGTICGYIWIGLLIIYAFVIFVGYAVVESIRKLIEMLLFSIHRIKIIIVKFRKYIESSNIKIDWE